MISEQSDETCPKSVLFQLIESNDVFYEAQIIFFLIFVTNIFCLTWNFINFNEAGNFTSLLFTCSFSSFV